MFWGIFFMKRDFCEILLRSFTSKSQLLNFEYVISIFLSCKRQGAAHFILKHTYRKLWFNVWHLIRVSLTQTWMWVTSLVLFVFASWDVASASENTRRKAFPTKRLTELKICWFVFLEQRKAKPFEGSDSFVCRDCLVFITVSTWICTDTAGSSWWNDSWTKTSWKWRTCPTSTRRILTAAITVLWQTGSASWSRDSLPS